MNKKKLMISTSASLDESKNSSGMDDDSHDEDDKLLENVQVETYEDYVNERAQRIKGIHKDLGSMHGIITKMKELVSV